MYQKKKIFDLFLIFLNIINIILMHIVQFINQNLHFDHYLNLTHYLIWKNTLLMEHFLNIIEKIILILNKYLQQCIQVVRLSLNIIIIFLISKKNDIFE